MVSKPVPGGWNRLVLETDDLGSLVARLKTAGAILRGDIVSGPGGKQALIDRSFRQPGRVVRTELVIDAYGYHPGRRPRVARRVRARRLAAGRRRAVDGDRGEDLHPGLARRNAASTCGWVWPGPGIRLPRSFRSSSSCSSFPRPSRASSGGSIPDFRKARHGTNRRTLARLSDSRYRRH